LLLTAAFLSCASPRSISSTNHDFWFATSSDFDNGHRWHTTVFLSTSRSRVSVFSTGHFVQYSLFPPMYAAEGIPATALAVIGSHCDGWREQFYAIREGDFISIYHRHFPESGSPPAFRRVGRIPANEPTAAEQNHWSERGRVTPVAKADALDRPRRSVLSLGA